MATISVKVATNSENHCERTTARSRPDREWRKIKHQVGNDRSTDGAQALNEDIGPDLAPRELTPAGKHQAYRGMKTRISGKEAAQVAEDMAKPGPIRVVGSGG
jgi:hypothetical protein